MNLRYVTLTLVLGASFAAPLFANADTVCTTIGQPCVTPGSISGTCNSDNVCQTQGDRSCIARGSFFLNESCTTPSGQSGTCDRNQICKPPTSGTGCNPACGTGYTCNTSTGSCVRTVTNGTACTPACGTGYTCNSANGSCVSNTTNTNNGTPITLINPLGSGTSLCSFLLSILQFVVRIGSIVVILMLVYVGYLFVVAQGNETKLTEAKKALLWTVVGALILLGAQGIAIGIANTVNAISGGAPVISC